MTCVKIHATFLSKQRSFPDYFLDVFKYLFAVFSYSAADACRKDSPVAVDTATDEEVKLAIKLIARNASQMSGEEKMQIVKALLGNE